MTAKTFYINHALFDSHQERAEPSTIVQEVANEIQWLPYTDGMEPTLKSAMEIINRAADAINRQHDQHRIPTFVADALLQQLWGDAIDLLQDSGYEIGNER